MRQNTSTAVMQRRTEPHDSLDDYPTPSWGVRALCEYVLPPIVMPRGLHEMTCWEPAANRGYMARPLGEYFNFVYATDIHDYGWEGLDDVVDFLFPHPRDGEFDWIISNPPFRLAEQFVEKSINSARVGCAFIVRSAFLEGKGRYERLFQHNPPTIMAQFAERVPMVKGRVDIEAVSATSYAWLVWLKGDNSARVQWIPPCRKQLERQDDYQKIEGEKA